MSSALNLWGDVASPEYVETKRRLDEMREPAKTMGQVGLVAAIALAILGIALCITTGGFGVIPLALSLPLFYFGYNAHTMGTNIQKIADNPLEHMTIGINLDIALRNAIGKGTFAFDWAVESQTKTILDKLK
jgi:hypothetical protein